MHAAFLKQLDPLQQEKIPVELHALGLEYCKFMYEKRPQNTHKHIINNRGTLAEAVAINDVNAFARHVWPTADKVRKMLFGVLQESLDAPDCPVRATSAHQGAAQEDAIKLSYARWCVSFAASLLQRPMCSRVSGAGSQVDAQKKCQSIQRV
jgi:hypothetical protein